MKRYITYILGLVLMLCITSCTKSEDMVDPNATGGLTLRLVSSSLTRAEGTNDDQNYEDDINKVDIYFYAGDGSSAAVSHVAQDITDGADGNTSIAEVELSSSVMGSLFANGGTLATLYVVANAPEGLQLPAAPTLAELKALTSVLGAWKTSAANAAPSSYQTSFLMDGEATFGKSTTELSIGLTRAAAKIDLEISSIKNEVKIEGAGGVTETWKPVIDADHPVTVTFANALRSTRIDGTFVGTNAQDAYDDSQAGYGFTSATSTSNGETITYYTQTHPFYSYASDWANGANEPYLLLTVYWQKNSEKPEATYYQIPVGSIAAKKIVRNTYYKVKINVGTVGSQEESVATPLEADYTVIDWSTGTITANIKEARYLAVDQTNIVLNNLQDISVAFQSSHPVSYEIVENTFSTVYTSNGNTWNSVLAFDDDATSGTGYVKQTGGTTAGADGNIIGSIDFHHELDNTREANGSSDPAKRYDYQANTIKIKVYHTDAENAYYEYITIEQRPAIYLISDSGNLSENNYVMVNTNRSYKTEGSSSGNILEWESVGTSSTNFATIFTISVSSFDNSTANYLITDPRVPSNNEVITRFESYRANNTNIAAGDIEADATGDDNNLSGYRRTIQGSAAENLVAPKFTVASACGTYKNGDGYIHAETSGYYRCATYQEAGYPAGRWRIPTPAELNVIGRLCAEKKITETIFKEGVSYMSSDGAYTYNANNGTFTKSSSTTSSSIRCVYDTWYWKDKAKDNSQFIWGAEGDVAEKKAAGTYDTYFTPVQQ